MTKQILISFFLLLNITLTAQNNTKAAIYNIGFGGLTGGIGSILNKSEHEKTGKVFVKGFYQGCLGGAMIYGSKRYVLTLNQQEKKQNLWTAKLIHNLGTSIVENATINRNFWEKWHLNIGFNRLEYDFKAENKLKYKVLPTAFVGTIISISESKRFDVRKSLQTLTPIFLITENKNPVTYINSVVFNNEVSYQKSISHEMIHIFQYEEFLSLNQYFSPVKKRWQQKNNFINKISNWVYVDIPSSTLLRGLYLLENHNRSCYYDNYFEQEANFYSNKTICP